MRVSVKHNDPGYRKDAIWYQPYLNGEKLNRCFTADEEMGCAWVYVTDENDNLVLNDNKTEILTKCVYGKIELKKEVN